MPPQSYIAADTPVNDVRVFVDGLHGQTRQAALEAAQRLRNLVTEAMIYDWFIGVINDSRC